MSDDISKYIYKDENSETFFVDTEDYADGTQHLQGYEDGDMVKWRWEGIKYIGTLRQYGNLNAGVFTITDAKAI